MPRRQPDPPPGDTLKLCHVCGEGIWRSENAKHRRSRKHLAAVARRKRERKTPESLDEVRVHLNLEIASMPRGKRQGYRGFAWRRLPSEAVDHLSRALYEVLERFAPRTVGLELGTELWGELELPRPRATPAPATDQLPFDFAQPRRRRADTPACSTPGIASPGTPRSSSSGRTAGASAPASRNGVGAAGLSSSSARGKPDRVSQRGKNRGTDAERAAMHEHVRAGASAKRAELGLEPVPPENLEYEATRAALKASKKKRKRRQ